MLDLAEALHRAGHNTTYQYCDTNLSPHADFTRAGVMTSAISTRVPFEKYKVSKRVICELQYGWGSGRIKRQPREDVTILNNLPLLSLAQPLLTGRLAGTHRVIWLQDVQSGLVASVAGGGVAARAARSVEGFLLRRADTVIAISDELAVSAREFGVKPDRIHVIENWGPISQVPLCPRDNDWSRAHGLTDRPRLLYSGTLARKHNPDALAAVAAASPDADVIVISEGVGADWLTRHAQDRGLRNLRVLPFQPFGALPEVLASGDVLLAMLTNDAASHSVPSKILSYLCAGRAIVASIPEDNAAARMINRAGAGLIVEPGDNDAFVVAAQKLLADNEPRERMGAAGRAFAEATFSSDRVAQQLHDIVTRTPAPR